MLPVTAYSFYQILTHDPSSSEQKLTAAIARNIEKETSACLNRNGGKLSLLKKVDDAVKKGGDEASSNAKAPKFNTKKQFRLTS